MSVVDKVVKVKGLRKIFRDFWRRAKVEAVRGISFEVRSGEVFGLLGPNGSGKSTTIKMLLGLLNSDEGAISVLGELPGSDFVKRHIGYLAEETVLFPELSAFETLVYLGQLFGYAKVICEQRAEQLLKMTGLEHARDRKVGEFSKGMARRIGIAQALINDPQLIILDEPTSGLDPIGCCEVKKLIRFLADQGKTVILTSHLLSDVQDVADYAIIIYGGLIKAEGSMDSLLEVAEQSCFEMPSNIADNLLSKLSAEERSKVRIRNKERSLEQLFLEVVREANGGIKSSGAREGTSEADYLKNKRIKELVSKDESPSSKSLISAKDLVEQLRSCQVELIKDFNQKSMEQPKKDRHKQNEKLKKLLD